MASSKKQQLAVCKAALLVLQDEIKVAKDKVITRENQLEKAIQEEKPVSSFEKLLDSASVILTSLQKKEKELIKRESQLMHSPSSSDDENQETISEGLPKRRKVDDLIKSSKKYLFRTSLWGGCYNY
ncbi:hypothetical protein HMI55_000611 [Coelomomyces lativittatus]|nr:hypothetical protein HMI56_004171 [Coelomomyces lativittatus]KAJ1507852.1 hypothetical protein HMI55_000611 [Coelomomyces lativittatus]